MPAKFRHGDRGMNSVVLVLMGVLAVVVVVVNLWRMFR